MLNKVAVAMSGGVDSAVTAALCVEKYGKENVFGITMHLFCFDGTEADEKSCCSAEAINDAKAVCDQLGIPHYAVNMEEEFGEMVIDNFVEEYQAGHTPNPCIRCNQFIKFGSLLKKSAELGADVLATGHYARILREGPKTKCQLPNNDAIFNYQLLKGCDKKKDQTYFLYNLNQEQLGHVIFPLGDITKEKTRKLAEKYCLATAKKSESQEICFVEGGNVADFLKPKVSYSPGDIMNVDGKVVGKHEGLPFYTIGQRKGLGGGFSEPVYVTGLDIKRNILIVGSEKDLQEDSLKVGQMHWISGSEPNDAIKCQAKIRYNMDLADCVVNSTEVTFKKPLKSITPGQSIVFYDGEVCLGGGIIQ